MAKVEVTEANMRMLIEHLMDLGLADKVIGANMGMGPSTFSRWWNGDVKRELSSSEIDRLKAYVRKLPIEFGKIARKLDQMDSLKGVSVSEHDPLIDSPFRSTAEPKKRADGTKRR